MAASFSVSVVIITHNADAYFPACLESLSIQSLAPREIVVVDSGSAAVDYLDELEKLYPITVVHAENIGFSRANNMGFTRCDMMSEYVLFLNPDTVLPAGCLETACRVLQACPQAGCLTPRMLGYDIKKQAPNGRLDSTGVFRKIYGRWYDRGQGEKDRKRYMEQQFVPAACGAFFFMRRQALHESLLAPGVLFDPDFFLYKEDIELSLRLRKKGWKILYTPHVTAYHCRGWQADRKKMQPHLKIQAAQNEIVLYQKHPSPYALWAILKWLLVRYFHV